MQKTRQEGLKIDSGIRLAESKRAVAKDEYEKACFQLEYDKQRYSTFPGEHTQPLTNAVPMQMRRDFVGIWQGLLGASA